MNDTTPSEARTYFGWSKPLIAFFLSLIVFLSLSRLTLVGWQFSRVSDTGGLIYVLSQGIRFDIISLAMFAAIPALFLPFVTSSNLVRKYALPAIKYYLLLVTAMFVFLELATPNYITQFDFRPNILFIEYLQHPREVFNMLIKAVPLQLLGAVLVTLLAVYVVNRKISKAISATTNSYLLAAPLMALAAAAICTLAIRSTLDHRPVNPSTVAFSSDPLVNSLPLNSTYSVLYAAYEKLRYENNDTSPYGELPYEDALAVVKAATGLAERSFTSAEIPTLHHQLPTSKITPFANRTLDRPKNLVIILEESLGADYVGKLGGLPITPNLDKLTEEGVWFDNLYATGTRSVRGIEAVVTGFLPTPMRSVVKLGGSQHDFFTIAELLSRQNYATSFIYGGEAHFDNMKRFFSNNGFQQIIDEKDYVNPGFYGSWGVSDEDLFNKAHETFSEQQSQDKPFFSLVFTSSNHSPFDFPEERIQLYEQPKATVANAVKYTDYALGEFIQKAKQSEYWEDTVFLVIADHSDRVFGADLVPIEKFHIPALVLNSEMPPQTIHHLCSQIDMLPTLLSMIGVKSEHPAIGIDLTRPDLETIPGRAIMQYNGAQAYMEDNNVVVLQKEHTPRLFEYSGKKLIPSDSHNDGLEKRAQAHAVWATSTYHKKAYHLPKKNTG